MSDNLAGVEAWAKNKVNISLIDRLKVTFSSLSPLVGHLLAMDVAVLFYLNVILCKYLFPSR